jgi:fumarate hydratase class II
LTAYFAVHGAVAIMMHNLLQSIQLLSNYLPVFTKKCVKGITVDAERCLRYVGKNPALAVFLSPCIGYLDATKIAKQALREKRSVKEVALQKGALKPEQAEEVFDPDFMLGKKRPRKATQQTLHIWSLTSNLCRKRGGRGRYWRFSKPKTCCKTK